MAGEIVLREGFDVYSGVATAGIGLVTRWLEAVSSSTTLVAGRFAGQAMRIGGASVGDVYGRYRVLDAPVANFTLGCAFRLESGSAFAVRPVAHVRSGNVYDMGFGVSGDGVLAIVKNTAASTFTILAQTAAAFIASTVWNYIEMECVRHATAGEARIYLNGNPTPALSVTGVNTIGANPTVDRLHLGQNGSGTSGSAFSYDDLYVKEGIGRLGPQQIHTLKVNADGLTQQWAPSIGTVHKDVVDESPVSFTDYVQASTVGQVEQFGFEDLPLNPAAINDVNLIAFAQKSDAATRAINLGISNGGTTSLGPDVFLAQGVARYERLLGTVNPLTGLAWNKAQIDELMAHLRVAA